MNTNKKKQRKSPTLKVVRPPRGTQSKSVVVAPKVKVERSMLPSSRKLAHKEMVGSITSAATTNWQALGYSASTPGYDINPANQLVFPWLSAQASCWEKYRFTKLNFELVPGNPTTYAGRIYAMIDYDYDDIVPASMVDMGASYGLVTKDVWQPFRLEVDCGRMNSGMQYRYVSAADRINGVEPRTVFGGYAFFAAQGTNVACTWDVFVDYEVELTIPQQPAGAAQGTLVPRTVPLNAVPSGNYYIIQPSATSLSLPTVVSGSTGVPALVNGLTSYLGANVLDIGAYRKGKFEIDTTITGNVGTPATLVPSCALEGHVFDDAGTFLSYLSTSGAATGTSMAAQASTAWATAAAPLATTVFVNLATLFATYTRAKYMGLSLYNGAAKAGETANTINANIRLNKLEL